MYHFLRFPDFKKKALTLSYDDCTEHDKRLVEIMDKFGVKGTFNINSGNFGDGWTMPKEDALALFANSAHEVAVHGVKHYSLTEMEAPIVAKEILTDRDELEKTFGRIVRGMAYANGAFNDEVVNVLKVCGIHYARTTIATGRFDIPTDWLRMPTTCHHNAKNLMELAEAFVKDDNATYYWNKLNAAKLFYLWGHSYEFDNNQNWDVIEKFCEFVGGREDIWYATNGEIYDYVQAYNRLEFSVSQEYVHNPSGINVYIDYFGKKIVVPAGETVRL